MLKLTKNNYIAMVLALPLAFTLVGCSNSNVKEDISAEQVSALFDSNSEEVGGLNEADSAVETAIGVMLEGGEKLVADSKEATQSESYQEAKEEALDNFITLSQFLRGEEEIAGYNISEVKEDTITYATEAWDALDEDLEEIYPNYKEKLKEKGQKFKEWVEEKGTDLAAEGYNKYQELKEKTLEKAREKKEKSK